MFDIDEHLNLLFTPQAAQQQAQMRSSTLVEDPTPPPPPIERKSGNPHLPSGVLVKCNQRPFRPIIDAQHANGPKICTRRQCWAVNSSQRPCRPLPWRPICSTKILLPGLDLVVVFDVPDEIALRRAVGRTVGEKSGTQFHQEFDPPPEGVRTGVGAPEKVGFCDFFFDCKKVISY